MRSIDYRRHAQRDPGALHLNAVGTALARRIGSEAGPYDRAVTSTLPRAIETAQAMGARVDATRPELATLAPSVERALGPIILWADYAASVRRSTTVARFAEGQREVLLGIAAALPEGGRGLVVSHGGILELGAVAALPGADHQSWGALAGYCEGIRLSYDGGRFVSGTVLRVAERE